MVNLGQDAAASGIKVRIAKRLAVNLIKITKEKCMLTDLMNYDEFRRTYPKGLILNRDADWIVEQSIAHPEIPLVLAGEAGTGKGSIARYMHRRRGLSGDLQCYRSPHELPKLAERLRTRVGMPGSAFLEGLTELSVEKQKELAAILQSLHTAARLHTSARFQWIASFRHPDDLETLTPFLRQALQGFTIQLPSVEDNPGLVRSFLGLRLAKENVAIDIWEFEKLAHSLSRRDWPTNFRGLSRKIDRILTSRSPNQSVPHGLRERSMRAVRDALIYDLPLYSVLASIERDILMRALERHKKPELVYRQLKIPRASFYLKRKKYQLN